MEAKRKYYDAELLCWNDLVSIMLSEHSEIMGLFKLNYVWVLIPDLIIHSLTKILKYCWFWLLSGVPSLSFCHSRKCWNLCLSSVNRYRIFRHFYPRIFLPNSPSIESARAQKLKKATQRKINKNRAFMNTAIKSGGFIL